MFFAYKIIEFPRGCDWLCGQWEQIFETMVNLYDSGYTEALLLGAFSLWGDVQCRKHLNYVCNSHEMNSF